MTTASLPRAAISGSREQLLVLLLCALAAIHVFVYSAVFPFFNPVDEIYHFDVVVKYSQARAPSDWESPAGETMEYLTRYWSPEYLCRPQEFVGGNYPPPMWVKPAAYDEAFRQAREGTYREMRNFEAMQPPLYYLVAGACWRLGRALHFSGPSLLYGVRFLNLIIIIALVWLGYATAQTLFPDRTFVRLGVPTLLAFFPQSAFYGIENDVLSPLCFGMAFLCLLRWLDSGALSFPLAITLGLSLAATFLTKMSNLPFLAVAVAVMTLLLWRLACSGKLRTNLPALFVLLACAGVPAATWISWTKLTFGDFCGTTTQMRILGWTDKPFGQWWQHPIFTPAGLWTYLTGLTDTFWHGEMVWQFQKMAPHSLTLFYSFLTLGAGGIAVAGLLTCSRMLSPRQGRGLWLSLACLAAGLIFLAFLSIIYDFHECMSPSRAHPYFSIGRLMLGAAIPFFLVFMYGLDQLLGRIQNNWLRPLALAALVLFMLTSELTTTLPVFSSQYNWFHM